MKASLLLCGLMMMSSFAFADAMNIDCKKTKLPNAATIQLSNGDDFGSAGTTGPKSDWSLTINGKDLNGAKVKPLGKTGNITGFNVTTADGDKIYFALSSDEKAFVFTGTDTDYDKATASYCSVDID